MADWRERGYVPDSDEEEDESLTKEPTTVFPSHADDHGRTNTSQPNLEPIHDTDLHIQSSEAPRSSLSLGTTLIFKSTEPNAANPAPQSSALSPDQQQEMYPATSRDPETSSAPSVIEQLQASLQRGLDVCKTIKSSPPPPPLAGDVSDTESPLSSPPGSLASSPRHLNSPRPLSPQQVLADEQRDQPASTIEQWQTGPIGRSFRPRTAVQLQPYTLDGAKHRTEWQSRGLRPVHLQSTVEHHHNGANRRQEDSQGDETFASSTRDPSPPRPTLRRIPSENSQLVMQEQQAEDLANGDSGDPATDDELPDLGDILRGASTRDLTASRPAKSSRHRLYSKKRPLPYVEINHDATNAAGLGRRSQCGHSSSVFDLPPSPPRSGSGTPVGLLATTVTPRRPPTPLVSSDKAVAKRNFVEVTSSSENDRTAAGRQGESSSEQSSNEELQNLVHIRRRIRGVLPASWIRLDAQHQKGKPDKHNAGRSPEKRPSKGLARQISRPPGSSSSARPLIVDLSSSDEESDSSQRRADLVARSAALRALFESEQQDVVMEDVVEDNSIDRMLPIATRRQSGRPRKKRQQRLDDAWSRDTAERSTPYHRDVGLAQRPREVQSKQKRHKKRPKPAQMTILDAPGLLGLDRRDQPNFLRVAARSKTTGKRARPQDPAQKFFQLATWEDTLDVHGALGDWQHGSRRDHKAHGRFAQTTSLRGDQHRTQQPAVLDSPRQQQASSGYAPRRSHNNTSSTLQLLKKSTDATLARLQRLSDAHPGEFELSTSRSLSTGPPKLHAGFVSWHGNRAGQGDFWNHILSRPTQLETPAPPLTHLRVTIQPRPTSATAKQATTELQTASQADNRASVDTRSRPRKQAAPRRTVQRMETDIMASALDNATFDVPADQSTSVTSKTKRRHDALARLALSTPSSVTKPPAEVKIQLPPLINHGRLTELLETHTLAKWLPSTSATDATLLRTPSTKRSLPCSKHDHQAISFIREIMNESMDIVANSTSRPLIEEASDCIETVIFHVNATLKYADGSIRDALIIKMAQILDTSLTFLSSQSRTSAPGFILSILNRLSILAYQIFAAPSTLDAASRKPVAGLWARTRLIALELALDLPGLEKLAEVNTSWDSISFGKNTLVYVESLFLWFHLTQACSPQALEVDVGQVSSHLYGESPEASMALVETIVPLLHSLSYSDTSGLFRGHQVIPFDPWAVLGPAIRSFLDAFSIKEMPDITDTQLGLHVLKICLSLATDCGWSVPDPLLQLLFKHYGKNDMIELFLAPDVSTAVDRVAGRPPSKTGSKSTDFEIFLRLITISLAQKSTLLGDGSTGNGEKGKITSLVFSLTPNNSPAVNEQHQLQNEVLQTMANTYALYATLFGSSPRGCRPRLTQVENLLDFSTSHAQIRELTMAAWARMSLSAVTQGTDQMELRCLASLGVKMWQALARKITTGMDATILEKSYFQYDTNFTNCQPVMAQMRTLLNQWATIIDTCVGTHVDDMASEIVAELLQPLRFFQHHFEIVKSLDIEKFQMYIAKYRQHDIDLSILKLLRSIHQKDLTKSQLRSLDKAREVASSILSADEDTFHRLEEMVRLWFNIAQIEIKDDINRWDLYLDHGATFSFPLLADTSISQQCEVLFLSHLVEEVPTYFELDPEKLYIRWLKSILRPESELCFEHILTARLISNNPGNLRLDDINNLVDRTYQGGFPKLKTFIECRNDIARHIVRSIHEVQFGGPDDSQDLIELPIDIDSGRRLLTLMTEVLRTTWNRIPYHSDPSYTRLVQAVIHELQIYTFPGFVLDPWFTDPQTGDFIAEDRFRLLFTRRPGSFSRDLDNAFIVRFRHDNQNACNTPAQVTWIDQMVVALSSVDPSGDTNTTGLPQMDGHLQIQFMQNVLSVYIQFTFSKGSRLALWTIPVIQILTRVIHSAHFRNDLDEPNRACAFAHMCLEILIRVRQALDTLVRQDCPRRRHVMMLAITLIELATACVARIAALSRYDADVAGSGCLEHAESQALAIYECVVDPKFDSRPGRDENLVFHDRAMLYRPAPFAPLAVPGTEERLRSMTVDDIDLALYRGRQPLGLGESWSAWLGREDSHIPTYVGWEGNEWLEPLEEGGEVRLRVLAGAVEEFYRVASEEAGVLERGDERWRVWDVLGQVGTRGSVPNMGVGMWLKGVLEGMEKEGKVVGVREQGVWRATELGE